MTPRRIGLILECGPEGADKQVYEALIQRLCPGTSYEIRTLSNKPLLVQDCGAVARALLDNGCSSIFIMWDLYPAWRERGIKPCRRNDRLAILSALRNTGVNTTRCHLICVEEELETWLISDERALKKLLSTKSGKKRIPSHRQPEHVHKPKTVLIKMYEQLAGKKYTDRVDAIVIVNAIPDFRRLRRCSTFVRFEAKLALAHSR